jgi:hypothetical protein
MHANSPQTQEQVLASKDRSQFRLTLALIILGALAFSIVAGWVGLVKPVAAADLSNGGFCIPAHSTADPEVKGMAGNCKPQPVAPEPERERVGIDLRHTNTPVMVMEQPWLFDWWILLRGEPDIDLVGYFDGELRYQSSTADGQNPAPITIRLDPEADTSQVWTFCYREYNTTVDLDCDDLDFVAEFHRIYG